MFNFSPTDGLRNTTTYPSKPTSGSAAREQIQGRFDEVRDYINKHGSVVTDTGTANTIIITLSPTPTIETDMMLIVKIKATNTGACTINVNSLGAKSIVKDSGVPLESGDLILNNYYVFVFNGTNWTLLNNYNVPVMNNISLQNSLVRRDLSTTRAIYYKDHQKNTTVEFSLKISGTTDDITHGVLIGTLPVNFRPANICEFPCIASKADFSAIPAFIRVHDTGTMYYYSYSGTNCMFINANFTFLAQL